MIDLNRDQELQSDNLVEEVLLSERIYEKSHALRHLPFSEKYKGRDEIEESRRFMSLSSDQKSKRSSNVFEGPAPPKPPRNYDSLPRGFKTPSQDPHYGKCRLTYKLKATKSLCTVITTYKVNTE